MNRRRFNQRNIALFGIVIGLVIASSARAQELQIGTGESPSLRASSSYSMVLTLPRLTSFRWLMGLISMRG